MIPESIHVLIRTGATERPKVALEDSTALFWVEWNEDDDQVPGLCAAMLETTELSSVWDGDDLYIMWRGRRVPVPLPKSVLASIAASPLVAVLDAFLPVSLGNLLSWPSRGNRHITILSLCQALHPDYEIRYLRRSRAEGCAAFAALGPGEWLALEQQYGGSAVEGVFVPIREHPNLFTRDVFPVDEMSPP